MNCRVYWVNDKTVGRIGIMPRPRSGDWHDDEIRSLSAQKVNVLVSLLTEEEMAELELTTEPEVCARNGIEFLSFPINDREVPPLDTKLKHFIRSLQDRVSKGKTAIIPCRAGIGRSAIIAACLMISPSNSVGQVMSSISQSRGFPVPDTREQLAWVHSFADWQTKDDQ